MVPNPITEEIREIRHRLAEQFDNDVYRIGADIRRRQRESGRRYRKAPQASLSMTTNDQSPTDACPTDPTAISIPAHQVTPKTE